MFQILKNPNFDFMRRRNPLLVVSAILMVVSAIVLTTNGLQLGIEFTGGNELQLKFREPPNVADVRSALSAAGIANATVTTLGGPNEGEIYIRIGTRGDEEDEDVSSRVVEALRSRWGATGDRAHDINVADRATLEALLRGSPALTGREISTLAEAISERRREVAVFESIDDLSDLPGMGAATLEHLRGAAHAGPLALRGQSYIFPAIGRELMQKALFAVLGSLLGMLIYIWIRFQFEWGLAAVVALTHDTLITLGLFSLFGKEMTLPVVAAFLTLIGYSVNDTVVVFDRIRENLRVRGAEGLEPVINLSINQTLSRTVITSGLTWVVVFALYLFGGAALSAFSFVLTVGVLVGTYSSIYVASPFLVLWRQFRRGRQEGRRGAARRTARKVSSSSAG